MTVQIYTQTSCKYCAAAKRLLDKRGLHYEEIELVEKSPLAEQLVEQTRKSTTPYIFIDGAYIGGFDELAELDQDGKLA